MLTKKQTNRKENNRRYIPTTRFPTLIISIPFLPFPSIMAISLGVGIVLGVYIAVMGFVFWFCVIADPETSPTARLIAHTLPNEFMKLAGKLLGQRGVKVIEAIMERLLAIIYLTVIIGCFSLLWWYGYPKARASTHIPDYHLTIGYIVVVFALFTWRKTMTTRYVPGFLMSMLES